MPKEFLDGLYSFGVGGHTNERVAFYSNMLKDEKEKEIEQMRKNLERSRALDLERRKTLGSERSKALDLSIEKKLRRLLGHNHSPETSSMMYGASSGEFEFGFWCSNPSMPSLLARILRFNISAQSTRP